MNHPQDLIKLIRPMQWIKSGFVFTGFLFSNQQNNLSFFLTVLLAAIAFSFASSCIYVVNDILDSESDRHHPKKKNRPLAANRVSIPCAIIVSIVMGLLAVAVALLASYKVLIIIFIYALLNLAYSFYLKHVVILDVFCIAAGFMLRILAGTTGVGLPPSKWLLLCGLMITLFLGFAKRRAEIIALSENKQDHRKVLENYGPVFLDETIAICATGVIITYSLYTMSSETIRIHQTDNLIYTVPFVIYAIFRYIFLLHHRNSGGDPTRDLLKDPHIIASVLCWLSVTLYLVS